MAVIRTSESISFDRNKRIILWLPIKRQKSRNEMRENGAKIAGRIYGERTFEITPFSPRDMTSRGIFMIVQPLIVAHIPHCMAFRDFTRTIYALVYIAHHLRFFCGFFFTIRPLA